MGRDGVVKKILRLYYREGRSYPVFFGPLRGSRFLYRRDLNYQAMAGFWERENLAVLDKAMQRFGLAGQPAVVADIGANMGYYSLYFVRRLSPAARIYAFEPSETILDVLKTNMRLNHCDHVEVVEAACGDKSGLQDFFLAENHHTSSLISRGNGIPQPKNIRQVRVTTIDEFFAPANQKTFPDLIKMDIEGAGIYALKGCDRCLREKRPMILIESHTPEEDAAVASLLSDYRYDAFRVNTKSWVKNKKAVHPASDGVWGTLLLLPSEKKDIFRN